MSSIASTQETDCSDVLCVGFGPAGLSIATAMADEGLISTADLNTTSSADRMKVEFLEKQASFCWHGGMLLDGSKMQISFLKDLVTLRNPSSRFSFVKYLHENDRLVPFMNLGSWTPYREEFNDYLSWVAAKFDNSCTYGERVLSIEPVVCDKSGVVSRVRVESENTSTGLRSVRETKSLVMAVGGQPKYPEFARMYFAAASNNTSSRDCPAVAHSSQYIHRVQSMLPDRDAPYTIAVIGQGQSGAELFMDLSDRYPNATIKLIFRDTALRPSDASPFVNEVFNPEYRDEFYQMSAQDRQTHRTRNGATNYSVVNSNLIDSIYGMLYQQGLPTHAGKRKCTLLPGRNVVAMEQAPNGGVILHLIRGRGAASIYESLTLNAVFLATGYERSAHETMLAPLMAYLRRDPATSHLLVGRDYKAQVIDPSRFQPAIYLQGCCEHTHGLSDTLLSVLGVRGGEVVESIKAHLKGMKLQSTPNAMPTSHLTPNLTPPASPVSGKPSRDGEKEHVEYPTKPAPATILFSRFIPELNETFSFRVADPIGDATMLARWHSNPRVHKYWQEEGTEAHQTAYVSKILASPHSIPCIGMFDDTPFAYFEIYWAAKDLLAGYYTAHAYDRGMHVLVGEEDFRGPHRVAVWLTGLMDFIWSDCASTQRIVLEPRADNAKMVGYLGNHGFSFRGNIQLPHKEAALMMLDRP